MARSSDGKFPKDSWPQSTKDKAQRLYTKEGKSIAQISTDLSIPVATLQRWCKQENWRLEKWSLAAIGTDIAMGGEPVATVERNGNSIEPVNVSKVSSALESEARENLLKGLKLLGSVGEEALRSDKLKFRDKKQAADVMLEALRGEVEIESTRMTTEFLREIAIAIQEEVKDEETLKRLAIRLTAIGKVFDTRILAK